jgi:hypothetical protein
MSCDKECSSSCPGRSLFKLLALLAIGALVVSSYKEILRYIKISTM